MKKLKKSLIITLTIFLVLVIFGIIYFYIFDFNKYGIDILCSSVGGIWCYYPSYLGVYLVLTSVTGIILVLLGIRFLVKDI